MVRITSNFDSGAIEVEAQSSTEDEERIDLRIRRDSHQDFTQWFHFRLQGVAGRRCVLRFVNAKQCSYPGGWEGYDVAASWDRADWTRLPTTYRDGVMTVAFDGRRDSVWIAYFEPYSTERHLDFLGRISASPRARIASLGTTTEGRDFDCVDLSEPGAHAARKKVWVIARQHPGETMAEWFTEGLIERLVDESDPVARAALALADFHIVPNMNPDGAARGNLRTNATGANLNREWLEPSLARSPEVARVRERMEATGVDLFIDAHGDEALPYVFVAGSEMLPGTTDAQREAQAAFVRSFKIASPDFQDRYGYASDKHTTDALKLASKWVGHRFGCLSLTLEMPFKDNADAPVPATGWNGQRSKRLGAAILGPMLEHLGR